MKINSEAARQEGATVSKKPSLTYQLAEANDRCATLAARVVAESDLADRLAAALRWVCGPSVSDALAAQALARYGAARGDK